MTNPRRLTISTYTDWYSIANATEYTVKQESHCLHQYISKSIENDYDPAELLIYSQRKCSGEALGKALHPNFMQVVCNFHNVAISSAQFLGRICAVYRLGCHIHWFMYLRGDTDRAQSPLGKKDFLFIIPSLPTEVTALSSNYQLDHKQTSLIL